MMAKIADKALRRMEAESDIHQMVATPDSTKRSLSELKSISLNLI